MPITNQPIATSRSMGEGAALFGLFTQTMMPGLALGFLMWMGLQFVFDDHRKSAPVGVAVVFGYWMYVGNTKDKAWRNMSRFVPNPQTYVGSSENAEIIAEYIQRFDTAAVQERRIAPSRSDQPARGQAPSGVGEAT